MVRRKKSDQWQHHALAFTPPPPHPHPFLNNLFSHPLPQPFPSPLSYLSPESHPLLQQVNMVAAPLPLQLSPQLVLDHPTPLYQLPELSTELPTHALDFHHAEVNIQQKSEQELDAATEVVNTQENEKIKKGSKRKREQIFSSSSSSSSSSSKSSSSSESSSSDESHDDKAKQDEKVAAVMAKVKAKKDKKNALKEEGKSGHSKADNLHGRRRRGRPPKYKPRELL